MNRRLLVDQQNQALQSLQLVAGLTVIPFGGRVVRWRTEKGGEYTGEDFRRYCLETGIIQTFAATNTPQKIGLSERVGRTLCAMVRCMLEDIGFPSYMRRELQKLRQLGLYINTDTPDTAHQLHAEAVAAEAVHTVSNTQSSCSARIKSDRAPNNFKEAMGLPRRRVGRQYRTRRLRVWKNTMSSK